jgi:hypothetical protein
MSVTICYAPKCKEGTFRGGTSTTLDVLTQEFGREIDERDIPRLRAMGRLDKFFDEVADAVEKYGEIAIIPRY